MQFVLQVSGGPHEGKRIPVSSFPFLIGRSDECHLRPKSETISRRHCQIEQQGAAFSIHDLKSREGTFVNSSRLNAKYQLSDGDVLRIGPLTFVVRILPGVDAILNGLDVEPAARVAISRRIVPKTGRSNAELCSELREALNHSKQIFCPSFNATAFANRILETDSEELEILSSGFSHSLILDTREGCVESQFQLAKYYQSVASQIHSTLKIAAPHDPHEQDIIQFLRDEHDILICFLFVEVVPLEQLCRIRSIIQEDHHSLVIYQSGARGVSASKQVSAEEMDRKIEKDLSDTKSEGISIENWIEEDSGKPKPVKMPPSQTKPMTESSKDAASEILRKYFGGR